ncbi:hypothetical protein [Sorangium sp. So ce406]
MKKDRAPADHPAVVVVGCPTHQAVRRAEDRNRWIEGGERRSIV